MLKIFKDPTTVQQVVRHAVQFLIALIFATPTHAIYKPMAVQNCAWPPVLGNYDCYLMYLMYIKQQKCTQTLCIIKYIGVPKRAAH